MSGQVTDMRDKFHSLGNYRDIIIKEEKKTMTSKDFVTF